jgi:DUF1680 family protein
MNPRTPLTIVALSLLAASLLTGARAANVQPVAYRASAALPDAAHVLQPDQVRLTGYLGSRVANNEKNRLLKVDEQRILAGFRKRPGEQAWIGEHVGKWLHAATLAWVYSGDPELRAKLDRVAAELIKTQEPFGYLGTYTPEERFGLYRNADWDVWVHKYNLIGLLTYYRYTGNREALEACRKIGNLLRWTFGPDKKSLISAGTHVGMASTSVLEPMVQLYRVTGDRHYLDFAKYVVASWDEPNGPKVLKTLTTEKSVQKTANGKAYEMLSNLVGLCELARATGDRKYLEPVVNGWQDVVDHQLYVTGSASSHEHFHAPYELPNDPKSNVGETCVTVTWIQLNAQLLRLTGEAKYGDELERSYLNHLAAAQRPDGSEWCYYTALEGTKPYGPRINCCVSSGPRGMALLPQLVYLKYRSGEEDGLAVNLFERSQAQVELDGQAVSVEQKTDFPASGGATLVFRMKEPARFALRIRAPRWAEGMAVLVPRLEKEGVGARSGWLEVPARRWKDGDQVEVRFTIPARVVKGDHSNAGKATLLWGPLVLAYDEKRNPGGVPADQVKLAETGRPPFTAITAPDAPLAFEATVQAESGTRKAVFVPFAEAGSTGGKYAVWLPVAGSAAR